MHFGVVVQKGDTPLGLNLLECLSGRGVYVNEVVLSENPIASRVSVGDLLTIIEDKDVSQLPLHEILSTIEKVWTLSI